MNRILLPGVVPALLLAACSQQTGTASPVEEARSGEPAAQPAATPAPTATLASAEPVMVGGEPQNDACGTVGVVAGLNPKGDNFLTVRAGPGTDFPEADRLRADHPVTVCEAKGGWLGIVYSTGKGDECGVGSPQKRRAEYDGPCKSGWVAEKYVTAVAG